MYCENCGAPLKEGAKFCPNCGAKVADDAPASAPASSYSAPASEPSGYRPSAFATGTPTQQPSTSTPPRTGKLYYPDPQRYQRFLGFNELAAMNRADDTNDFPDE